jgi:hypothetical protein
MKGKQGVWGGEIEYLDGNFILFYFLCVFFYSTTEPELLPDPTTSPLPSRTLPRPLQPEPDLLSSI